MKIGFNRPCLQGNELVYMSQAVQASHLSGNGDFTKKCQQFLESTLGVPKALLTTSCTDALEMAAILLDIRPGDEVILPSFTFVSTANAFVLRGAKPVFLDIRKDTLNIDETLIESAISPRTKALVIVHYAGISCEMDSIVRIAQKHSLTIVEDNAHGLFGKYKGKPLGTFGALATQSFHETKNVTCGEGGALLINDPKFIERAEIIWEKGTNRSRFFQGKGDKYSWVDIGSSFLMSDILAAFLWAQLENAERIQTERKRIWEYYNAGLRDWAQASGIRLPTVPAASEQAYHLFYLIMPSNESRSRIIAFMKEKGISVIFHYLPLHSSEMGRKLSGGASNCPVTEDIAARLVRLPFHNGISMDAIETIVKTAELFKV